MPSTVHWSHSVADRPTIDVASPPGGWGAPWPNVAEIEALLPHQKWTLVGGLMTQLHGIHRGIDALRPTNDVDIVLHVETSRGVAAATATVLESLGYRLTPSIDDRNNTAHRFKRGESAVDMVSSGPDVVDVLVADHAAPSVVEKLRGRTMVAIEGGTQALRRTINARLKIEPGHTTTVSVPSPFGAVILKAAAYQTDSRDRERHLQDAALLLAVIEDPYVERDQFAGSDKARLQTLVHSLPDGAREWQSLPADWRASGQAALRIMTS
jgi:predicted nucleotidyltransferase